MFIRIVRAVADQSLDLCVCKCALAGNEMKSFTPEDIKE